MAHHHADGFRQHPHQQAARTFADTTATIPPAEEKSLLNEFVGLQAQHDSREQQAASQLQLFLDSESPREAALLWLGEARFARYSLSQWKLQLASDIARIERLLETQVNEILHHAEFQKLEGSWQSLRFLIDSADTAIESNRYRNDIQHGDVKILLLDSKKQELSQSFRRAISVDETEVFIKVYEERFGQAGGEPIGLLVGNYEFSEHPEDIALLRSVAGVAAASFAPFIAAASPELLGFSDFSSLNRPFQMDQIHSRPQFARWLALRRHPDARFLGLTLPRMLLRRPYQDDGSCPQGFRFEEDVTGQQVAPDAAPDISHYLWGNAAFGFAAVAIRAYARTGWFADIRGVRHGSESGGVLKNVTGLTYSVESSDALVRPGVEINLSGYWEQELGQQGFIPLMFNQGSSSLVFRSNHSVFDPGLTKQDSESFQENEKLAAMLQYVLCASRFAHHLKAIMMHKIGTTASAEDLQEELNSQWLQKYVSSVNVTDPFRKAEYPLREASLEIKPVPGKSGVYHACLQVTPHYQLDSVHVSVKLESEISK